MKGYSETIKEAWGILKPSFWLVFGTIVVAQIIIALPNFVSKLSSLYFTQNGTIDPVGVALFASIMIMFLTFVVQFYLQTLLGIGVYKLQLNIVDKKPAEFSQIFSAEGVFWRYLWASILYGLLVVFGLILLVVPGIYWAIKYQFVLLRIIDKKECVPDAFKGSAAMTKGYKGWLFGLGIVMILLFAATIFTLFIGLIFVIPLSAIIYVLVYRKLEKLPANTAVASGKKSEKKV